jgi:hypothetical protein
MNRTIAAVSGEVVQISGQAVETSGAWHEVHIMSGAAMTVTGAVTAAVSGQTVWVSGGQIGAIVSGTVVTSVSGQPVTLVSGALNSAGITAATWSGLVLTSGVWIASGIGVVTTQFSGAFVSALVSGTVTTSVSGQPQAFVSGAFNSAGITAATWSGLILTSGVWIASGVGVVAAQTSGAWVNALVSGTVTASFASGAYLASGLYIASGIGVVTTQFSGAWVNALVSGTVAASFAAGTALRVGGVQVVWQSAQIIANSNVVIKTLTVRAVPRNSGDIYIGDSSINSGIGLMLSPGDGTDISIDNLNKVYGIAQLSGDKVSYLGVT